MNPLNAILVNSAQKLVNALHKQGNDMLGQGLAAIVQLHSIIYALLILFTLAPKHIPFFLLYTAIVVVLWGMYYRINCKLEIPTRKNILLTLFLGTSINIIAIYLGGMPQVKEVKVVDVESVVESVGVDGTWSYPVKKVKSVQKDVEDTGGLFFIIISKLLSFLMRFPLVNYGVKMFLLYIFTYLSGLAYFKILTFLSEKNIFVRKG